MLILSGGSRFVQQLQHSWLIWWGFQAYFALNDIHCAVWTYRQLLPVIHNYVFFMHHSDFSIRRCR